MLTMALRNFRRDWRAGEVKVLFFALMVAVAAMVAIGVITDRIQRAMGEQASEFLGADYVISSPREMPQEWLDEARSRNLTTGLGQSVSTVLSKGDKFQLVSVDVIQDKYPLKGELEISQAPFEAGIKLQGKPEQGKAWVEPRVLSLLEAKVGDEVEFGSTQLTISCLLYTSPSPRDQRGSRMPSSA